jgi:hypothetical protein
MKKLYLTAFTLLFATLTFAQDYDINSYKFRYQKYKGFTLSPSFSNKGNHDFTTENNENLPDKSFANQNSFNGNLNLAATYFSTVNIEELQQSINTSGSNNISWSGGNQTESEGRNNSNNGQFGNSLNFNYSNTTRHYKSDNTFKYRALRADLSSDVNWQKTNRNYSIEDIDIDKSQNARMTISASIGKGKGRVENVTDVIQAHFILEDLKTKKGVTYTNAQLERLAQGITFIRNQRYLDPRFRVIDQLSMLDSTLSTIGIAPEKDIKYFTSINDNGSTWT